MQSGAVLRCRLQSKGLALAVDITNAFAPHFTRRLNTEHLSNGGGQVSFLWVCKLAHTVSDELPLTVRR